MDHVIYRLDNGEIVRNFSGPAKDAAHQAGAGEGVLEGLGTWLTHKVVDGVLTELDAPRMPPADGSLWWDPEQAAWFDPMQRAATAAAARAERRGALMAELLEQESRQLRPLREIEVARLRGHLTPAEALEALERIDDRIVALRAQLQALV